MAPYVFVPGGKRNSGDWEGVRAILEARGRETWALTLPDPEISTLEDHIATVKGFIRERGFRDVILVGHSYGGVVVTGAAGTPGEGIAKLVYVDSSIPRNGQSLWDIFSEAGMDPGDFGVPAWPPFTQKLHIDQSRLDRLPKVYVRFLQSEFLALTRPIPQWVRDPVRAAGWKYFEMDAGHYGLLSHPKELAAILLEA